MRLEDWWQAGERITLEVAGVEHAVFVQRQGEGPLITFIHGFPSSSYEWRHVARELARDCSLLLPDLLGFGASDKPRGHAYSIGEQADLIEGLWKHDAATTVILVAHDYGASVAQELLARHREGALRVELAAVHLLNGGIYPDLHRPRPLQSALADPVEGPRVAAALDQIKLTTAIGSLCGPHYDPSDEGAGMWQALSRYDGHLLLPDLSHYLRDREVHGERWVRALEETDVPLSFTWGMLDPNSGGHVADRISERLRGAPLRKLADVGHWPQLEVPGSCIEGIRTAANRSGRPARH